MKWAGTKSLVELEKLGVELQRGDLAARQVAIVLGGRGSRRSQNEARLARAAEFAGENPMGRKVQDAVAGEIAARGEAFDRGLGSMLGNADLARIGAEAAGNGAQLVRRFGQWRVEFDERKVDDADRFRDGRYAAARRAK